MGGPECACQIFPADEHRSGSPAPFAYCVFEALDWPWDLHVFVHCTFKTKSQLAISAVLCLAVVE